MLKDMRLISCSELLQIKLFQDLCIDFYDLFFLWEFISQNITVDLYSSCIFCFSIKYHIFSTVTVPFSSWHCMRIWFLYIFPAFRVVHFYFNHSDNLCSAILLQPYVSPVTSEWCWMFFCVCICCVCLLWWSMFDYC